VLDQNDAEQSLKLDTAGDKLAITFKDAKDKRVFTFDRGKAWDLSATQADAGAEPTRPAARKPIHKHIALLDDGTARLFEGVPYSWLTSAKRQLPVTLDYQVRTGTSNGSEAWQSGVTYFVSNNYTVPNGKTLVMEGGAVVKLNPGKQIRIENGAKILAKGTNYNYAVITNAEDDVGEPITDPEEGNGGGIVFSPATSSETNNSEFDHVKFHNLDQAISFESQINLTGYKIRHCIFRDCPTCIYLFMGSDNPAFDVLNCLMTNDGTGVAIWTELVDEPELTFDLKLRNLTINDFSYGVVVIGNSEKEPASVNVIAKDNLFSNCSEAAFFSLETDTSGSDITDNRFYNCGESIGFTLGDNNITLTSDPYKTSPNGSFYTAEYNDTLEVVSDLDDEGESWGSYPCDDEMQSRTIVRPHKLDCSNINMTSSGERYRFDEKGDYSDFQDLGSFVDIGYHYDIVNAVIWGSAGLTTSSDPNQAFVISPGSCISYASGAQLIVTGTDTSKGYLKAQGTATAPILFTSTHMTGDGFSMPASYHYGRAIDLYNNPSPDILIEYCEFSRAERAIFYRSTTTKPYELNTPIANCVFKQNYDGIYIYNACNRVDIWNSLFVANENSAVYTRYYIEYNNRKTYLNLQGNTFSQNNKGLLLDPPDYQPNAELRAVVEDNIFSSNNIAAAAGQYFDSAKVYDVTRNNIFWNNGTDIQNSALDISDTTNEMTKNPLFVHYTRSKDGETVADYSLPGDNDGHYLSQRSGDASRRAYRLGTVTNISNVSDIEGLYYILIGVSEEIPGDPDPNNSNTYKGKYDSSQPPGERYTQGSQQGSGPTWVIVWAEEFAELLGNPRFNMTTDRGTIWVYLPQGMSLEKPGDAMGLFLTEDGSIYYGHPSQHPRSSNYFDQDAYYAERWAQNNVARSAYEGRLDWYGTPEDARSPGVDAGSRDLLNDGYTKTIVNLGNPSDSNRDNPNTSSGTDDSLLLRMDIGYHYFGSLRHPRENVETILVEDFSAYPRIQYAHHLALASAKFDPNQNDTTILTYRFGVEAGGEPPDPPLRTEIWLYKIFRDSSPGSQGHLEKFDRLFLFGPMDPRITATAMTSVPNSSEGTIYAACTVNWWKYVYVPPPGTSYYVPFRLELDIWRYKEGSGRKKICSIFQQIPIEGLSNGASANDVALVARNDDLWVFYTKNSYVGATPQETGIIAVYLKDAATWNEEYLMSPNFHGLIRNLNTVKEHALTEPMQEWEDPAQIDVSWDDQEQGGYPGATGLPHIIWWDLEADGNQWIRSAWVQLAPDGRPRDITETQKVIMSPREQFWLPAIEVNDYDDQKFSISDAKRAFASSRRSVNQPKIQGYQLPWPPPDPNNPWEQIAITDRNNSLSPDTTFRAFATPRFSFVNGGEIFTNTEHVYGTISNPENKKIFTRITTNTGNLTDVFLIYSFGPVTGEAYTLHIMEVDP